MKKVYFSGLIAILALLIVPHISHASTMFTFNSNGQHCRDTCDNDVVPDTSGIVYSVLDNISTFGTLYNGNVYAELRTAGGTFMASSSIVTIPLGYGAGYTQFDFITPPSVMLGVHYTLNFIRPTPYIGVYPNVDDVIQGNDGFTITGSGLGNGVSLVGSQDISITFPVFSSTTATSTNRFNGFNFTYALNHNTYPYYEVGVAMGTDPSQLPIKITTGNLQTSAFDTGTGSVQAINNPLNDWVEGVTYYARLVLWGLSTSTVGATPPIANRQAMSEQVVFTIRAGQIIQVIPPTVAGGTGDFTPEDCSQYPAVATYAGIPFIAGTVFSRVGCEINNTADKFIVKTYNFASSSFSGAVGLAEQTFPLNIITHVRDDITAGSVASSTPAITLGGAGTFGGRNYTILDASTTSWIATETNFDYRGFISKFIWLITGGIILTTVATMIGHMHKNAQNV